MPNNHTGDDRDGAWHEWRGTVNTRLMHTETRQDEHALEIADLKKSVSAVLIKLAVPLFAVGILGPVVGAFIVMMLTNALKK